MTTPSRISRDGIDIAGILANAMIMQRACDGQTFYATDIREQLVWNYALRTWTPVGGKMVYAGSNWVTSTAYVVGQTVFKGGKTYVCLVAHTSGTFATDLAAGDWQLTATIPARLYFDEFRACALDSRYSLGKGSDGSAAYPALVSGSAKGELNLVTGAAGDTVAHDASSLTIGLDYVPADGAVTVQAVAKLTAISNVAAFIGLNDALDTSLEMPMTLATATVTANATNAVGFLFDTAATTKHWWGVSVNAGGTPQKVDLGVLGGAAGAPTAATYQTLKVTVDTSGNANFYIGGTLVGTLTAAVAAATPLTPIAVATARTTASQTLTLDLFCAK